MGLAPLPRASHSAIIVGATGETEALPGAPHPPLPPAPLRPPAPPGAPELPAPAGADGTSDHEGRLLVLADCPRPVTT
jgi:hypothetical protein